MRVSLCLDCRRSFSPFFHRGSGELSVAPTMCCLWYLLPLKWIQERQASIPKWLFPSDFSNGVGNSGASRENQLQGAGRECGFTAFMINSICIFIDKCYSTGNFAPLISQRACSSKQDLMIYLGAGSLLINSVSNGSHLSALIGCPGHVISLYFIRCDH